LATCHDLNITHKDINPGNLIWNRETNRLELIDFGICSQISRESQQIDRSAVFSGSPPYISPEQTGRMARDLDYRTDFYSLVLPAMKC